MALEELIAEIKANASREAEKLSSEIPDEVAQEIEEAKKRAKEIKEEIKRKTEDEIKKEKNTKISLARLQAKRALDKAKGEILENGAIAVFEEIKK